MCVCVCEHVCACMHSHVFVCVCVYVRLCMSMCLFVCVCISVCATWIIRDQSSTEGVRVFKHVSVRKCVLSNVYVGCTSSEGLHQW